MNSIQISYISLTISSQSFITFSFILRAISHKGVFLGGERILKNLEKPMQTHRESSEQLGNQAED